MPPPGAPRPYDPDPLTMGRDKAAVLGRIRYQREMARLHPESNINWDDFKDFIRGLGVFLAAPIIIPMRLIHHAITSPLTISLVLKLMLLGFLLLASSIFSLLAVGAFFWSWKIGGAVEVEGWLYYGSKNHRPPHTTVYFPLEKIEQDLKYDVQVELELVRPTKGTIDEIGNFMLSLELRALSNPERVLITAAQPSLPPPSLPSAFLSIPALPTSYIPCIIPYPFRSFCPSRLLGYAQPNAKIRERRAKGGFSSRERGKEIVPLKKDLMEGVVIKPAKTPGLTIGSSFVSIGREDLFEDKSAGGEQCKSPSREVKTTGWVLIRLIPRPTGIRWILSSHPLPPLLLLPPLSLSLTFSSSLFAFAIITFLRRGKSPQEEKELSQVKSIGEFEASDKKELEERERRQNEWEEMQSSTGSGMLRKPSLKNRSGVPSTVGGSETTLQSSARSFGPTMMSRTSSATSSSASPSTSDSAETVTPIRIRDRGTSTISGGSSESSESGSGGDGDGNEGRSETERRGSRRTSATGSGSGLRRRSSERVNAEGSDTERDDKGNKTDTHADDWREFGKEFGLNT
ncbi:uncharacterized protein IL334_003256 [Kwoniella shivajii]|uniref:Endoplasmic reticulum protein n=1 Tax=Kwoniella shivajii TaxID=564305 RepID=A0ABZ1CY79_9TREE|nr:hypothetical protein IL334_003256 [Kwoniella shivajii]